MQTRLRRCRACFGAAAVPDADRMNISVRADAIRARSRKGLPMFMPVVGKHEESGSPTECAVLS